MEVTAHLRNETWEELLRLARMILRRRLTFEEWKQLLRVLETPPELGPRADELFWRLLSERHLTEEQRQYADRYLAAPEEGWPWPAPERLDDEAFGELVGEMMSAPPSGPRSRAAQQLLMVSSCIDAAHRARRTR